MSTEWFSMQESNPPANPHQFCVNAGIDAVQKEFGQELGELREELCELMLNIAATAAQAAIIAGRVAEDWCEFAKTQPPAQPSPRRRPLPPAWTVDIIQSPVDLYTAMGWTYQEREQPSAFDDLTETQRNRMYDVIDDMLRFVLMAANVDMQWEQLCAEVRTRVQAGKGRVTP